MVKKFCTLVIFVFALLFLPRFLNAQKITASVTETFDLDLADLQTTFKSGGDYITYEETEKKRNPGWNSQLHKTRFGLKLLRYDASMKVIKENHLFNGERKFGPFTAKLQLINDKQYLIYSTNSDDEQNNIRIIAAEINPESLELGPAKEILRLELGKVGLTKSLKIIYDSKLYFKPSPDHSKLMAFWTSHQDNIVYMSVLNAGLNPVWSRKEVLNGEKDLKIFSTAVDNNGVVYTSYKYTRGKNDFAKFISIYQVEGRPKEFEVKLGSQKPFEVLLTASNTGKEIYATGTWLGESQNIIGVFRQAINTAGFKAGELELTPFSLDLLKRLNKESWASIKPKKFWYWCH